MIKFFRNLLGGAIISAIIGVLTYLLQYTQVRYWFSVVLIVALVAILISIIENFIRKNDKHFLIFLQKSIQRIIQESSIVSLMGLKIIPLEMMKKKKKKKKKKEKKKKEKKKKEKKKKEELAKRHSLDTLEMQVRLSMKEPHASYSIPSKRMNRGFDTSGCTLFIIIFLILLTIPFILFTWILNPEEIKQSVSITVLVITSVTALIYYILFRHRFRSPGDVASFFGGAIGLPIAVAQIFL